MKFLSRLGILAATFLFTLGPAMLGTAVAAPKDYELGMQAPVTPVMERIESFHHVLLWIISLITLFVLALLLWVMLRYNEKRNPTPSKTTHNVVLELAWTVVPVLILIGIAFPSFRLLYFADQVPHPDMTIKAIGRQWYWSYEYPDNGDFTFDSYVVADKDLKPGQPRLLTADNALVLPVDTNIRIQVTSSDVIHDFAMPPFGIKTDAVPGRINETWAYVPAEYAGKTFYGQCSELCGTGHAYMPIMIHMVTKEEFKTWVEKAKQEYAQADQPADQPTGTAASPKTVKVADASQTALQSK